MSAPLPRRLVSVEEYLRFEESADERHEYVAGQVYAMSGASGRHHQIVTNVTGRLWVAGRGGPCGTYAQGMKVQVPDGSIYYPDVLTICGPQPNEEHVTEAPTVIVEVTSPSTRRIDLGEKAMAYREILTLRLYLVVEQARRRVLRHWRDAAGAWQREELIGEGTIAVPGPETTLTLDEIYEGVQTTSIAEPEIPAWPAIEEEEVASSE
jgi:Uma2 family endonuclease